MKLPWPELPSSLRPQETIRQVLDYLAWIGLELAQSGYLDGPDREPWRRRIHTAYHALFLPPVSGHGDPYPPDVPPARSPGIWPDIPSAGVPGMTVRHQLKVIRLLALDLRDHPWPHGRAPQFLEWDRRLSQARAAVERGPDVEIPKEMRTSVSEKVLAEAKAQDDAKRNLQRKRERAMKRLKAQALAKKNAPEAPTKKAAPKKATPKKKVAPKKKATVKKKAAPKKKVAPKKKAAVKKKAAPKKKATPAKKAPPAKKKVAKKGAVRKKPAPKKKKAAPKKN